MDQLIDQNYNEDIKSNGAEPQSFLENKHKSVYKEFQYGHGLVYNGGLKAPVKGKKLQVGSSRLTADFEMSCQTGHLIDDFECQTSSIEDGMNGEQSFGCELEEKLVQTYAAIHKRNKKVQSGFSCLNIKVNSDCQSEFIVTNSEVQTEPNIQLKQSKTYSSMDKDSIGKMIQVGLSRIKCDSDVSCQTGRTVRNYYSQTDNFVQETQSQRTSFSRNQIKRFDEKEIQSEPIKPNKTIMNSNEVTRKGNKSNEYPEYGHNHDFVVIDIPVENKTERKRCKSEGEAYSSYLRSVIAH